MDALDTTIAPEPVSTVIDVDTETAPSGGGAPRTLTDDDKGPSLRDTIADVVKEEDAERAKEPKADPDKPEAEAKDAKPAKVEEKADEKPKTERAPDGKFAPRAKADGEDAPQVETQQPTAEQAEKAGDPKHYPEPPKSFLPDSKEVYKNVPRAVRRDIAVMEREHEAFREQATQATERYQSIKPFDDLARNNGRDLRESLLRMNEVENAMQRDPVYGLNEILKEIGPRKADGSAVSIYDVASHIIEQGPQQFQQRMQGAQSAQPQAPDPRVAQTEQALQQAHEQLVALQVITPFKADHARYDELEDTIAGILQSGMIRPSLSAPERLEAAYVMAERLVPPSSHPAETEAPAPIPPSRAAESLSGSKSIKSAPGAVSSDMEPERGGEIRDILQDEVRRMKRS